MIDLIEVAYLSNDLFKECVEVGAHAQTWLPHNMLPHILYFICLVLKYQGKEYLFRVDCNVRHELIS